MIFQKLKSISFKKIKISLFSNLGFSIFFSKIIQKFSLNKINLVFCITGKKNKIFFINFYENTKKN
jgi:hypothetical protein